MPPRLEDLPNAFVLAPPVVAHSVDQPAEMPPEVVRDGGAVLVVEADCVHQLAVDIELELVVRAVADPHGPGTQLPVQ